MAQSRDGKETLHEGEDKIVPDLKLMYKAFMSEFMKLSTGMDGMDERINEASRIQNRSRSIDSIGIGKKSWEEGMMSMKIKCNP